MYHFILIIKSSKFSTIRYSHTLYDDAIPTWSSCNARSDYYKLLYINNNYMGMASSYNRYHDPNRFICTSGSIAAHPICRFIPPWSLIRTHNLLYYIYINYIWCFYISNVMTSKSISVHTLSRFIIMSWSISASAKVSIKFITPSLSVRTESTFRYENYHYINTNQSSCSNQMHHYVLINQKTMTWIY